MMTEQQRFLFDLNGYLVLPKVLDADHVKRLSADMASHGAQAPADGSIDYRFSDFLNWGEDWRNLIDHDTILPVLEEVIGGRLRLDHAYGMAMRANPADTNPGNLHHQAGMFHHACFYVTHGDKTHNGLVVVSYALSDTPRGAGGFICIPGSHKTLYPVPAQFTEVTDNPLIKNVELTAGDVLVFTEALTHGTAPWTDAGSERRALLFKYCPHYMQWAPKPMNCDIPELTDRQKLILQPPYVAERPEVVRS